MYKHKLLLDRISKDKKYINKYRTHGLGFNAQIGNTNINTQTNQAPNAKHQNWNARFIEQFNTNLCKTKMEEINTYLNKVKLQPNQDKINLATAQITQLQIQCRKRLNQFLTCRYSRKAQNKPWYGIQCAKARTKYTRARKRYQNYKNGANRNSLNHESKQYKK